MCNYFVYGSEPALIRKKIKEYKEKLSVDEFSYMESSVFTENEINFCNQISLFGSKQLLVLSCKMDDRTFLDYLSNPSESTTILYVPTEKIDGKVKQSKKFKTLTSLLKTCEVKKLSASELKDYIKDKIELEPSIIDKIIYNTGYLDDEDVNLYNIDNILSSLLALDKVTPEIIEQISGRRVEANIFKITNLLAERDPLFVKAFSELPTVEIIKNLSIIAGELKKAIRINEGFDNGYNKYHNYKENELEALYDVCLFCIESIQCGTLRNEDAKSHFLSKVII